MPRRETAAPGLRVLIADDEQLIADTLTLILARSGFRVSAVYSGEEAVAKAADFRPDVLISDVVMGAMDGIEAALAIQRFCPDCRVILVSGHAANVIQAQGQRFEILPKPVHPSVLLERLRAME